MRRRDILGVATLGIAGLKLEKAAAQAAQPTTVGILMPVSAEDPEGLARTAAFEAELARLGWQSGQEISFDYRWAAGSQSLMQAHARDLVAVGPDLLLVQSNEALSYLTRETRTIPIVVAIFSDPVGTGHVESMRRPGGNVTGFANLQPPMAGKWVELLLTIAPEVDRIGVLFNPNIPANLAFLTAAGEAALTRGLETHPIPMKDRAEIEQGMGDFGLRFPRGGLVVCPNPQIQVNRELLVGLAEALRLPAIYPFRFMVSAGGLISYGIDIVDVFRRAAGYVDLILRGTPAGNLPVQEPTTFELAINLATAHALSLSVPYSLLAQATELIE